MQKITQGTCLNRKRTIKFQKEQRVKAEILKEMILFLISSYVSCNVILNHQK